MHEVRDIRRQAYRGRHLDPSPVRWASGNRVPQLGSGLLLIYLIRV